MKIGKDKMTTGSDESIVFWCNKALARRTLSDPKVTWIDAEQFDEVRANRRWKLHGAT